MGQIGSTGTKRSAARSEPVIDGPVRTCIGCRKRGSRAELLRVVAETDEAGESTGKILVDPLVRLPGRGAWLHIAADCLEKAEQRRAFGRALRLARQLDVAGVTAYITEHVAAHDQNAPARAAEPA